MRKVIKVRKETTEVDDEDEVADVSVIRPDQVLPLHPRVSRLAFGQ